MIIRFLSWLLWLANARMRTAYDSERAYRMKDRILRRFGKIVGEDIQRISRICYSCDGSGSYDFDEDCRRCRGTGVFDERWFRLERWELGGRIFHRPAGMIARPMNGMVTIEGKIYHDTVPHRASAEAFLWLALFADPELWWANFRGSRHSGWQRTPMLALQAVLFELRMKFSRKRCPTCYRSFFTRGTGWVYCRSCRAAMASESKRQLATLGATADDDLPF
jgi:hypothetical protein